MIRRILSTLFICGMLFLGNAYADWAGQADKRWRAPVTTVSDLPPVGNSTGDARVVTGSNRIYGWNGTTWVLLGSAGEQVKVSSADTTASYLDNKLAAGDGLSKAILTPGGNEQLNLYVNVDGSTIEINSDTLRVKDGGITEAKLDIVNTGTPCPVSKRL